MATDTKWTPGPWKVGSVATDERGVSLIEIARGPMSVAWVVLGTKPAPRDVEAGRADARLIAAAPDLYAALESAEFRLRSAGNMLSAICESDPTRDRREAANRAIAAANVCAVALRRARGEE